MPPIQIALLFLLIFVGFVALACQSSSQHKDLKSGASMDTLLANLKPETFLHIEKLRNKAIASRTPPQPPPFGTAVTESDVIRSARIAAGSGGNVPQTATNPGSPANNTNTRLATVDEINSSGFAVAPKITLETIRGDIDSLGVNIRDGFRGEINRIDKRIDALTEPVVKTEACPTCNPFGDMKESHGFVEKSGPSPLEAAVRRAFAEQTGTAADRGKTLQPPHRKR